MQTENPCERPHGPLYDMIWILACCDCCDNRSFPTSKWPLDVQSRYCLLKQAIRLECARGEEFPQPSLLSALVAEKHCKFGYILVILELGKPHSDALLAPCEICKVQLTWILNWTRRLSANCQFHWGSTICEGMVLVHFESTPFYLSISIIYTTHACPCRLAKLAEWTGLHRTKFDTQDCNEWRCFHGSSPDRLRGICETNFKPTMAGTGATWKDSGASKGTPLYGFGFYFAERITKAGWGFGPL